MSMSPMTWRYEFIATHPEQSEPTVLEGANFTAIDADNAKLVLARAVSDLTLSGPTRPHAIRLLDPDGWEVWRGLLAGARPARWDGVPEVAATAPSA
jgi:hypothetical protein